MSDMMAFLILFIPLAGTTLGALLVFFMKKSGRPGGSVILAGFASGVMLAASVWSLIIPAIDMSDGRWREALIGFSAGVLFLILTDRLSPEIPDNDEPRRKTRLLAAAVTLHNIPEGMAVGVALAGALSGNSGITFAGAFSLSLGIAIQNVPEAAMISMPLAGGMTRRKAFACGFLSGVPEPLAGRADSRSGVADNGGSAVPAGVRGGSDVRGGREGACSRVGERRALRMPERSEPRRGSR